MLYQIQNPKQAEEHHICCASSGGGSGTTINIHEPYWARFSRSPEEFFGK